MLHSTPVRGKRRDQSRMLAGKDHSRPFEITKASSHHPDNPTMSSGNPEDPTGNRENQKPRRVASLDVFRGITVALMVLVDGAGGEWPKIGHAPWNGCNLADFVMPFFLFIVGMAVPLSLKRIPNTLHAVRRVGFRTVKLIIWGIILQGGYSHALDKLSYGVDLKWIRWCGILQRIALAYLLVSILEIFLKGIQSADQPLKGCSVFRLYLWQWFAAACILVIYLAVLYLTYVPDWEFTVHNIDDPDRGKALQVSCGTRGNLDPPCNAVAYIDRKVLGINHMYDRPAIRMIKVCTESSPHRGPLRKDAPSWCQAPFEPEGILSSLSAVLSTIIGVHYGHVLVHMKDHINRLKQWFGLSFILLVFGIILHFSGAIPLNKQLYSFSYVCVTSGTAAIVFSVIYILVDVLGLHSAFLPMKWIGMNAMLVFVMAAEGIFEGFINGWYYDNPDNTLVYWIKEHVFIGVWHSERVGILLYVIFGQILFWAAVAGIMHKLKIYWKL